MTKNSPIQNHDVSHYPMDFGPEILGALSSFHTLSTHNGSKEKPKRLGLLIFLWTILDLASQRKDNANQSFLVH